ncbi:C40 family peptidase [Paenibacillus marinisediminis]
MKMMKKLLLGLMMVTMTSQMMVTGVHAAAAAPLAEPDYMITSPTVSGDESFNVSDPEMAKLAVAIEEMNNSTSDAPVPTLMASTKTGTIVSSVNLRKGASTSSSVIRKLNKGEKVTILDQPSSGWYKVKDSKGTIGYMSSSSKYINVNGSSSSGSDNNYTSSSASAKIEKVIQTGYKYLGTPYEYGSNRNTTTTFDCSDFVRHIYKTGAGITLPSDSRSQGSYIKSHSTVKKNIDSLKRGDLMFFGKYRGSSKSDYKNVNKNTERITHVGVYLGDGKILHTYSKESGGVRVDTVKGKTWEYRFLFGGSVIQ